MTSIFTFGMIGLFTYWAARVGHSLPLIVVGNVLTNGLFYFIGLTLSRSDRNYSLVWPAVITVAGFMLSFVETSYIQSISELGGYGQKPSSFLFATGAILLLLSARTERAWRGGNPLSRMITRIGDISFGIYFTHVYLIIVLAHFLPSLRQSWPLFWAATTVATIAVIHTARRLLPSRFCSRFLGYY